MTFCMRGDIYTPCQLGVRMDEVRWLDLCDGFAVGEARLSFERGGGDVDLPGNMKTEEDKKFELG